MKKYPIYHRTLLFLTAQSEKILCLTGKFQKMIFMYALKKHICCHCLPHIVVLDEATSALDNVTESIVMKNVLEQIKYATVIAVAHRLTSIREFDRIIVFRNGKIVDNGTFDELLENNSYFLDLYRKENA